MLSSPLVFQFLPLVFLFSPSMSMTDEQFFKFCHLNHDLRIERNRFGEISIKK
jgi:hypothetical protein